MGRFNVTTGQGAEVFLHDPANQNLEATFVRRDRNTEPDHDRRLADLGQSFTEADILHFTVDWTPVSEAGQFAWPIFGLFDDAMGLVSGFKIKNSFERGYNYRLVYPNGVERPLEDVEFPDWRFGRTYRLAFTLDGPSHSATFSASELVGEKFVLIDRFRESFSPGARNIRFLGISNLLDDQFRGTTLVAHIDNFGFAKRELGDLNCDGTVNAFDIEPFLLALFEPSRYVIEFPDCDLLLADINLDGFIDAFDIEPFLNVLFP